MDTKAKPAQQQQKPAANPTTKPPRLQSNATLTWNGYVRMPVRDNPAFPFKHKDKLIVQIVDDTVVISKAK